MAALQLPPLLLRETSGIVPFTEYGHTWMLMNMAFRRSKGGIKLFRQLMLRFGLLKRKKKKKKKINWWWLH